MVGTLGRVKEFDGNKDDWQQYVERLEHFFQANDVDGAEKKRAVFLSVIPRQAWGNVVCRPRGHVQAGTIGDRRAFPF